MATSAAPVVHSVHFYETDEALLQRLCAIVFSGMNAGVSAVLIMTPEHKASFRSLLEKRAVNVHHALREGRLFFADAERTLSLFMRNGMPSKRLFVKHVGRLIKDASAASKLTGLTAFGEMVAILWAQGNKEGALALEAMWNDLLEKHSFHLHCAYPMHFFSDSDDLRQVCDHHSLSVGFAAA
jgi:hypothetical protein